MAKLKLPKIKVADDLLNPKGTALDAKGTAADLKGTIELPKKHNWNKRFGKLRNVLSRDFENKTEKKIKGE